MNLKGWCGAKMAAPAMLMFRGWFLTPARHRPAALTNGRIAEHLGRIQRLLLFTWPLAPSNFTQ